MFLKIDFPGKLKKSDYALRCGELRASRKYMPDSIACPPYDGAKNMLPVTIIDDRELLQKMVSEMFDELPERKPKIKKSAKN